MAGNDADAAVAPRTRLVAFDSVPVIDLDPFLNGGPEGKAGVARAIGDACQGIGFFYVTNHGVPQGLIDALFTQSRRFFALPHAEKMRVSLEGQVTRLVRRMSYSICRPSRSSGDVPKYLPRRRAASAVMDRRA